MTVVRFPVAVGLILALLVTANVLANRVVPDADVLVGPIGGVLWGLLRRESGRRVATVVSSVLFGCWHVLPALAGGTANESVSGVLGAGPGGTLLLVAGTVLFTGLAGVLFCVLRARSGGLLAPILRHWVVNGSVNCCC